MGFDGKTLIHPNQIGPCNAAFSPSARGGRAGAQDHRGLRSAGEPRQGRRCSSTAAWSSGCTPTWRAARSRSPTRSRPAPPRRSRPVEPGDYLIYPRSRRTRAKASCVLSCRSCRRGITAAIGFGRHRWHLAQRLGAGRRAVEGGDLAQLRGGEMPRIDCRRVLQQIGKILDLDALEFAAQFAARRVVDVAGPQVALDQRPELGPQLGAELVDHVLGRAARTARWRPPAPRRVPGLARAKARASRPAQPARRSPTGYEAVSLAPPWHRPVGRPIDRRKASMLGRAPSPPCQAAPRPIASHRAAASRTPIWQRTSSCFSPATASAPK